MSDRNALIADLSRSVEAIMTEGIAGLPDGKKLAVAGALTSGAAEMRMTFFPSYQTFIVELISPDGSTPDQELFRIVGAGPSGEFH